MRTVARLSGCAFAGQALARTEGWMDTSVNYATTVFIAAIKLQFFPKWMRPVAQYLIPDLYEIPRMVAKARAMLVPLVEERLRDDDDDDDHYDDDDYEEYDDDDDDGDNDGYRRDGDREKEQGGMRARRRRRARKSRDKKKPDDFVQWLLDVLPDDQKRQAGVQAHLQLILSAASIHTTSNLVTDCIYDLATHQDMQEELRREAEEVLLVDGEEREEADEDYESGCYSSGSTSSSRSTGSGGGGGRGWFGRDSLAGLRKMDSFMRESQRLHGNVTSFIRKVMRPVDLSDGTHLPAGASLLAPLAGVSRDDRFYPDADTFDGLRFWRLREQWAAAKAESAPAPRGAVPGIGGGGGGGGGGGKRAPESTAATEENAASRWQFTSIGDANTNFGLGRHACPGRFFAAAETKLILAYLLLRYDIRLKEGEGRPRPMMFMMTKSPSPSAEIMFRRRRARRPGSSPPPDE